jgi:tetratricopeptide (TPR) repeat protein
MAAAAWSVPSHDVAQQVFHLLTQKRYSETIAKCDEEIRHVQEDSVFVATLYALRGQACIGLERYVEASNNFSKALAEIPPIEDAYLHGLRHEVPNVASFLVLCYRGRALCNLALGQSAKALDDLNKLCTIAADEAENHVLRGVAYFELAGYKKAISDFDRAIFLDPAKANAYAFRGLAYLMLGNEVMQRKNFVKAKQLRADIPEALLSDDEESRPLLKRVLIESILEQVSKEIPKRVPIPIP